MYTPDTHRADITKKAYNCQLVMYNTQMAIRRETYMPICSEGKLIIIVNDGTNVVVATEDSMQHVTTLRTEEEAFLEARQVAHDVIKCKACKGNPTDCIYEK